MRLLQLLFVLLLVGCGGHSFDHHTVEPKELFELSGTHALGLAVWESDRRGIVYTLPLSFYEDEVCYSYVLGLEVRHILEGHFHPPGAYSETIPQCEQARKRIYKLWLDYQIERSMQ